MDRALEQAANQWIALRARSNPERAREQWASGSDHAAAVRAMMQRVGGGR